jgi:hypothetical protein
MKLTDREQEAYDLVGKLNGELYTRFGDDIEGPGFFFLVNEVVSAIEWGDHCVWDSENDQQFDDDDNELPIEPQVRLAMQHLATAAEWVSRERCCRLDCTGDGGANACIETLEKPDVKAS